MKILRKALIIIIAFPAATYPMQWVKSTLSGIANYTNKPTSYTYATKARNAIAAMPLIASCAKYLGTYGYLIYEDSIAKKQQKMRSILNSDFIMTPEDFVKQELGRYIGKKSDSFLVIDQGNYGISNAFSRYGVFVDGDQIGRLLREKRSHQQDSVFENAQQQARENELREIQGILAHEANHVMHNDVKREKIAQVSTTVATTALFNRLSNLVPLSTKLKTVAQVPLCGLQILTNVLLFRAWDRFREQQADDAVPNDIPLLRGLIASLRSIHKREEQIPYINSFRFKLFSTHPPTQTRIEKIEQRIAELEKQAQ